jgi:hypothetical protein
VLTLWAYLVGGSVIMRETLSVVGVLLLIISGALYAHEWLYPDPYTASAVVLMKDEFQLFKNCSKPTRHCYGVSWKNKDGHEFFTTAPVLFDYSGTHIGGERVEK